MRKNTDVFEVPKGSAATNASTPTIQTPTPKPWPHIIAIDSSFGCLATAVRLGAGLYCITALEKELDRLVPHG